MKSIFRAITGGAFPKALFFSLLQLFIFTVFTFLLVNGKQTVYAVFAMVFFSLSTAFILFASDKDREEDSADPSRENSRTVKRGISVFSPLSGNLIPLKDVKDETFAEGIMGEGLGIIPTDDRVYAPVSGLIVAFFETHHAITVLSDEGAEILIHVGRDTVELKGKHFTPLKKAGDRVKAGDALLVFDRKAIAEKGYDVTTPVTVANSSEFSLRLTDSRTVTAGDHLMTLTKN